MTKLTREIVHSLHNQGQTFSEIGRLFGVSKQYAHNLYTGYLAKYRRTDKFRMYKRHFKGHENPYKPCEYCESTSTSSIPSTV